MRQQGIQRYKSGASGAYSEEYHRLLGKSAWIVIRRLERPSSGALSLSEGDIATVFSQFGEVIDVRFVRHHRTGKFLGTAFVRFEDYRSAILAADAMNSDREKGKAIRLTATAEQGICVERCEEAEVTSLPQGTQSYAEWIGQLKAEAV